MNNDASGAKASKLSKTFIVTSNNALFQYAYLPVIEDGAHSCCGQSGFNIRMSVTNTLSNVLTVLACPQISVAVPGSSCLFTPPPGTPSFIPTTGSPGWAYHNWTASAIDLTSYINNTTLGNQITIDVVVVDCIFGGHGGYAFFDAKCSAMTVLGNNNAFPAGSSSFTLPTCGANSATICAPDGLGPYSWAGPGVVAPFNTPLNSNQCFTVGVSANFTLTMNPPGSCQPINRLMTVTITPAPLILSSVTQAVCGGTSAVVGFTAAGSASVNPTIVWTPVPTSTTASGANLGTAKFPVGIGVVTVTATDPLGCKVTATVNILPVPPQPTVSIVNVSGSQSITCITPTIDLQAASNYTYGSLTYFWSSNAFTSALQAVTVVNASTLITLQVADPATGCVGSATTSIRVNTVVPVSTVNPINQNINCGPGIVATSTGVAVSPTINVTHCWFAPGLPAPSCSGGQVSIYTPPIGTSTFVLTDNINGCFVTKTVQVASNAGNFPTFNNISSLMTANVFTLGCGTRSLITDVTINGANAVGGGVVSYTLLPASFTGTNYTTGSNATYSINSPGAYFVVIKDNNSLCESRTPLSIIQDISAPNISAEGVSTRTLSCFVPSISLQGTSTNAFVAYSWKLQNGQPPTTQNGTITVVTTAAGSSVNSATVIDTYTLTVTNLVNTCTSNTIVTIYQNTRPPKAAIALSQPALTCGIFSVNLTNNSTSGVLPNTFFGNQGIGAVLWEGPPPQTNLANNSSYSGFTPGAYTLTARDLNNGCTAKTTTLLIDNRVYPVITASNQAVLDCGADITGTKLAATVSTGSIDIVWETPPTAKVLGEKTLTLTTNSTGEYKLTVTTKSNSCTRTAFFTVTDGVLNANFTADATSGYAPLTVNFTNNSASSSTTSATSSITSVWSFGNGTTRTTTTNLSTSATYDQPGTYSVTMFAGKGSCLDTFVKVIRVDIPSKLEVPNVFTPNGDNTNDIFFIKAANLSEITALIYDRWGNKIYELTTEKGNIAWDGKTQTGKEAPDGTYFYIITAKGKDGQNYDTKGTVSLYR